MYKNFDNIRNMLLYPIRVLRLNIHICSFSVGRVEAEKNLERFLFLNCCALILNVHKRTV